MSDAWLQARTRAEMRRGIIWTFEVLCIAMVILPTVLGILWVFLPGSYEAETAILQTVGVFLLTSFLAGGALTLVEIARNTRGGMEALRDMRDRLRATQEAPAAPRRPTPGGDFVTAPPPHAASG